MQKINAIIRIFIKIQTVQQRFINQNLMIENQEQDIFYQGYSEEKNQSIARRPLLFQKIQEHNIYDEQQQRKLKYPTDLSYSFPIKLLLKRVLVGGQKQFKQLMKLQAGESNLSKGWGIQKLKCTSKDTNQLRIYVRCKHCNVLINYIQDENNTWKLVNYRNNHIHDISNKKAYKLLMQKALFENLTLPNEEIHDNISKSYPVCRALLLKRKSQMLKKPNFQLLKSILKFLKYDFKCDFSPDDMSKENYPQTLVAVSLQQKENYRKYGECMSYDITYNCIKETAFNGKKFGVGIFSGFDNNNRILIFGFSLTTYETSQHFKNIFKWFFNLMGFTHTSAIITDQQKSLISALQGLKQQGRYNYHHIYDNWHFIRAFKNSLKIDNQERVQSLILLLRKTMRQSDFHVGRSWLKQIKDIMQEQNLHEQYQKLQNKLDHVCLWRMPKQFLGLSLHSNECLNDLLKIKVEYQTRIATLIERLDKVSKQRTANSETKKQYQYYPFEQLHSDPRIKQVRIKFEKKPFNTFIFNYTRSLLYVIQKQNPIKKQYQIMHVMDKDLYQINNLQCSCGALQKTGIPCQHIIFITRVRFPNNNYVALFHERWLPRNQNIEVRLTGRRKRSRRNLMR